MHEIMTNPEVVPGVLVICGILLAVCVLLAGIEMIVLWVEKAGRRVIK